MAVQSIATVENFSFGKRSESRYSFQWKFGERRYHLWAYQKDGKLELDTELHSNHVDPKVPGYGPRGHKKLDIRAQVWLRMWGDLTEAMTPELIAEADALYAADEHRAEEKRKDERYAQAVARINRVLEGLGLDSKSRTVFCALLTLPRDDLIRLI